MAVKSERHRPLQRVLEMVKYLADHRFGAEIGELAKEMDMTPRNVYRYIRAMDEAGVDIERSGRAQWEKSRIRLKDRTVRCMFGGSLLSGRKARRTKKR